MLFGCKGHSRENATVERLFEVKYEPQNGEENESTEHLSYAMVQQGRKWFMQYSKDK